MQWIGIQKPFSGPNQRTDKSSHMTYWKRATMSSRMSYWKRTNKTTELI